MIGSRRRAAQGLAAGVVHGPIVRSLLEQLSPAIQI